MNYGIYIKSILVIAFALGFSWNAFGAVAYLCPSYTSMTVRVSCDPLDKNANKAFQIYLDSTEVSFEPNPMLSQSKRYTSRENPFLSLISDERVKCVYKAKKWKHNYVALIQGTYMTFEVQTEEGLEWLREDAMKLSLSENNESLKLGEIHSPELVLDYNVRINKITGKPHVYFDTGLGHVRFQENSLTNNIKGFLSFKFHHKNHSFEMGQNCQQSITMTSEVKTTVPPTVRTIYTNTSLKVH